MSTVYLFWDLGAHQLSMTNAQMFDLESLHITMHILSLLTVCPYSYSLIKMSEQIYAELHHIACHV